MNKTALVLGTFDGVHIGHMKVLESARDCDKIVALTFPVPPAMQLGKKGGLLISSQKKEEIFSSLGITVESLDFSAVRHMSPKDFLSRIQQKHHPQKICCGFNYRFGENGAGDTKTLEEFCLQNGITLCVTPPVLCDGIKVSSSLIRMKIADGKITDANCLLGRPFTVGGEVIHGDSRGRTLGFPTVNFFYPPEITPARHGVYAARCNIDGKAYGAVTYIGNRPTYRIDRCIAETNILNFSGNLYGNHFEIELMKFLRDDRVFASAEELREQISEDVSAATL